MLIQFALGARLNLRVGELVALDKRDIHLNKTNGAKFGYLQVRSGKSKNAKGTISLTARARKCFG